MKKTFILSIQSILIITILHFLIKNYLLSLKIMNRKMQNNDILEKPVSKNIVMDIQNIEKDEINMENVENFNEESMKKELESYLEEETAAEVISEENTHPIDKIQGSNSLDTLASANLINQDSDLDSYFQIEKHGENKHYFNKEMAQDIMPKDCKKVDNSCKKPVTENVSTENVSTYNEWVYDNENIMNGGEIFNGITAYDDMDGGYATYDLAPITS